MPPSRLEKGDEQGHRGRLHGVGVFDLWYRCRSHVVGFKESMSCTGHAKDFSAKFPPEARGQWRFRYGHVIRCPSFHLSSFINHPCLVVQLHTSVYWSQLRILDCQDNVGCGRSLHISTIPLLSITSINAMPPNRLFQNYYFHIEFTEPRNDGNLKRFIKVSCCPCLQLRSMLIDGEVGTAKLQAPLIEVESWWDRSP